MSSRATSIGLLAFALSGPVSAGALLSCDRGDGGPSFAGWCHDGSFTGLLHVGSLVLARAEGDVAALAQVALWTETGDPARSASRLHGSQVGLANFVHGGLYGAQVGVANLAARARGLQVGLLGNFTGDLRGVQLSLARNEARDAGAFAQLGLLLNRAGDFTGVQLQAAVAAIPFLVMRWLEHGHLDAERELYGFVGMLLSGLNHAERLDGVQVAGWMNEVSQEFRGGQLALVNVAGRSAGVQVGAINVAASMTGLQVGVVNRADQLRGAQIGLVNVAGNGLLKVLPVLNVGW